MIFAFSFKKNQRQNFCSPSKMMIFHKNGPKSFFLPKNEHFSFKSVISMIWVIFWCILLVCRTKIGDFEKSSHNSHIRDPRQPRGRSWGDYATQGADQELKWKLRTISVWKNWVVKKPASKRVKDIEINVARREYQMTKMKFTYIHQMANGYFLPFQDFLISDEVIFV